jgi:PKHD-type hydroxylase
MIVAPPAVQAGNDTLSVPLLFARSFTPEECLALRSIQDKRPPRLDSLQFPIEDYRHAHTWYIDREEAPWAFSRLAALGDKANGKYRLDITGIEESLLLVRYVERGHFAWHADSGPGILSRRKISLCVQLSQPGDYDGGGLEFSGSGEASLSRGVGTAVAFPAFLSHRVAPVTRGERWSLVGWVHGPPFR